MAISDAARIAIAFVRPFRSYLDKYNSVISRKEEFDKYSIAKIDNMFSVFTNKIDQDKINNIKQKTVEANRKLFERYESSYKTILVEVIDNLLIELEKEINITFSKEEQRELCQLLNNTVFLKLIESNKLFSLLKNSEINIEYKLLCLYNEFINSEEFILDLKDTLNDLGNQAFREKDFEDNGFDDNQM